MGRIMIAGTSSNVGKTTVAIGLMAAYTRKGYQVNPFKTGPDYIDPGFHKYATKNHSYNLDSHLLEKEDIHYLLSRHSDGDLSIIEGVMGFYDGHGIKNTRGSSADMAKVTQTPVILVIDGSGVSSSAAATVLGFQKMDPQVVISGVIVNKVSGNRHYQLIKEAIEHHTGIECVGYLPKNKDIHLDSRHLGLIPAEEMPSLDQNIEKLVTDVNASIELEKIVQISKTAPDLPRENQKLKRFLSNNKPHFQGKTIAVAKDAAFSFYYQNNLDILKELGVELVEVSPLKDQALPENVEGLYLGGGFPEVFAKQLAQNESFLQSVRDFVKEGRPCYGECGGFFYLSRGIRNLDGLHHEFAGVFPFEMEMTKRLVNFGYVNATFEEGSKELSIKGHEFHHSKIVKNRDNIEEYYQLKKEKDGMIVEKRGCGARIGNTMAGYPHFMFLSNPEFINIIFRRNYERI
ncbi:MAG TPA: cobyrinate a,c-diamide synthase [Eubacteriaceae bacterium]|nr:cobyrinate a,c-diamide synthase [Eubacteriaceae bacterium]